MYALSDTSWRFTDMRCLVTGAAGFLGSYLLSQLLDDGAAVTLLLRSSSDVGRIASLLPYVRVVTGDLRTLKDIEEQIIESRPEVVFHLAWSGGNSGSHQNDLTQFDDNLAGALALLQITSKAGARRWVGIGSGFEYGQLPGVQTERVRPEPNTLYAISKYALCLGSEKMCALSKMEYLWVRPFATYGVRDDPRGLIPFVTQSLLRGERPALTAGEQKWDYLHAKDAAQALALLASATAARGIYNLASGEAQTIRSLVEHLRDLIDPALPLGFGEITYSPDQIMSLQADTTKLKATIAWRPRIVLEDGLRAVIQEFRESLLRSQCL